MLLSLRLYAHLSQLFASQHCRRGEAAVYDVPAKEAWAKDISKMKRQMYVWVQQLDIVWLR